MISKMFFFFFLVAESEVLRLLMRIDGKERTIVMMTVRFFWKKLGHKRLNSTSFTEDKAIISKRTKSYISSSEHIYTN
jgi:hypothetical protein